MSTSEQRWTSEIEVESQRVVEREHEVSRNSADGRADPLYGDRTDLFGLRFRRLSQPAGACGKHDLEWVHAFEIGRDRNDCHDATAQSLRRVVCRVVADDDSRAAFVGL